MSIGIRGGANSYIVISGGAGDPQVLAGTVDPSAGAGVVAAEGSTYMRYGAGAGEFWLKTGAANTAWVNLSVSSVLAFFGNAIHGSDVLAGDLGPDNEWYYQDLDTNGFDVEVERLFVRGTLTVRTGSHVHQNGADAVVEVGGDTRENGITAGGKDGPDGDGGDGANGVNGTSHAWGGEGGDGGQGAAVNPGGNGGTITLLAGTDPLSLFEMTSARTTGAHTNSGDYVYIGGGASGAAGGGNNQEPPGNRVGGGGGGGGSVQVICARNIIIETGGFIEANGGDGGNGEAADCGGGGGGGAGVVMLVYETLVNNGAIQALGGAGGASGGGTGVAGDAGSTGWNSSVFQLPTI